MILPKIRWSTLVGLVCTISFVCYAVTCFSQSPHASVQLVTQPALSQVVPMEAEATAYLGSGHYESPVHLRLQALDAKGTPLENAQYRLQIFTPPPTPWFTTDFPIVEGTQLLDISGEAPTGEIQLEQAFPIRGNYQLKASFRPLNENAIAPIEQTLTLTIPENPLKLRYFPIILGFLLVIGFLGGWVIGSRQQRQAGEIAPRRVRLLLSGVTGLAIIALLFFNIRAELAQAQMTDMAHQTTPVSSSGFIESQGMMLELTGDSQTSVGQMASLQAKLTDSQTNQAVTDAILDIKATQLEDNWVAFANQGVPNQQGILAWQEQFFDGAPHQISVKASPKADGRQFQPFEVTKEISVKGIAPPLLVRFVGLIYFTGVLSFGLVLGLWFQKRRFQSLSTS